MFVKDRKSSRDYPRSFGELDTRLSMDSDCIVCIIGLYPALNEIRVVDSVASYGACHHVVVRQDATICGISQYICLSAIPATGSVSRDLFPIPISGLQSHARGSKAVINKKQLPYHVR